MPFIKLRTNVVIGVFQDSFHLLEFKQYAAKLVLNMGTRDTSCRSFRRFFKRHDRKCVTRRNFLQMASWRRKPKSGLLHHSDRGSQYTSKEYRNHIDIMNMRTHSKLSYKSPLEFEHELHKKPD